MGVLQVTLLGSVRVTHNNWLTEAKLTREIQILLAYLLLQRHRVHSREVLAGVFWEEHSEDKAHRALNTALWRLKKALEPNGIPAGTYLICSHSGDVGFNCQSQYWLDVEVFERETDPLLTCPSQIVDEPHAQEVEKILELYRGELLEEFYDDWALRERERMRALYVKGLIYLMQYYEYHGAYERASTYAQQVLNLDPLREDIHRDLMKLYLKSGQRALAARQYGICQLVLAKELGISPMEETRALYAQIFPEAHKIQVPPASEALLSLDETLGQLCQALQTMDRAREQFQQALQCLTKYSRPEAWTSSTASRCKV